MSLWLSCAVTDTVIFDLLKILPPANAAGTAFGPVCLSVSLYCSCSNFWKLWPRNFILACRYINGVGISRSSSWSRSSCQGQGYRSKTGYTTTHSALIKRQFCHSQFCCVFWNNFRSYSRSRWRKHHRQAGPSLSIYRARGASLAANNQYSALY